MTDIEALEKLAAIEGPWHDKYVEEVKKFNECPHPDNMMQQFTERCLKCGYNVYYGPGPRWYLEMALKESQETP